MFFDRLRKLIRFFTSLNGDEILFEIIVKDNQIRTEILNLNRLEQLFKEGVDSKNVQIGVYSPLTERISRGKKKAGTHYTLFDTGDFYRSFRVIPNKTFFEIVANPIKGDDNLFDKYGEDIVGLTDESKQELAESLIPKIQEELRMQLPR